MNLMGQREPLSMHVCNGFATVPFPSLRAFRAPRKCIEIELFVFHSGIVFLASRRSVKCEPFKPLGR